MKQKKTLAWCIACLGICLVALTAMTGCGASDDAQPPEETIAVEETEATEAAADEMLTEEEALESALEIDGFYIDDVDDIHVDLDTENGATEYDITFRESGVQYEYSVDAYTGDVYEYE